MLSGRSSVRDLLIRLIGPFSILLVRERPRRRIIALHDIPPAHHALFRHKMEWLKERCHIVSIADLAHGKNLNGERLNVALSFDDGFKEYATFVAPILEEMHIPATFFTPSGALDLKDEGAKRFSKEGLKRSITFEFMTKDELQTLAQNPLYTIGGHTIHHTDVETLEEQGLEREVAEDKRVLEGIIGKEIQWFAYPFGGVTNISASAVQKIDESGYVHAFSIIPAFWKKKDHPYIVGRDSLSVTDSDELWGAWLLGGYDALSAIKNEARMRLLRGEVAIIV